MRIVFAGRDNSFNRKFFTEISEDHEVLYCLFLEPGRKNAKDKCKRIGKRLRKYGLLKVIDELAFHLFDRLFLRKPEITFKNSQPEYFNTKVELPFPSYTVENIHDAGWINFIKQSSPDIIFSLCCSVIFKPDLTSIPKYGTFILHEGLTPEYKGLHTTLWALLKKDYKSVGYTLFKANNDIDGGEILVQETYTRKYGEDYRTWSWISHNALIEGLDNIKRSLKNLEKNGNFEPIEKGSRESGVYTWMTLTKFLYLLYFNNKKLRNDFIISE
ncbi:MAG: formyltransferase family protein [Bacteroidetes bacterium]|nr:formyltransferase family protein [Bacteroidota bacterium]